MPRVEVLAVASALAPDVTVAVEPLDDVVLAAPEVTTGAIAT